MGTAMMNRYVVDKRERRRGRVVGTLCREAVRNRLIMGGLHCHLGPCDIGACTAT